LLAQEAFGMQTACVGVLIVLPEIDDPGW
jgi:hypothetical protein